MKRHGIVPFLKKRIVGWHEAKELFSIPMADLQE